MEIYVNNNRIALPVGVNTIGKLIEHLNISKTGTGVGLNNRLVPARNWDSTLLSEDDRLTVISATYGG